MHQADSVNYIRSFYWICLAITQRQYTEKNRDPSVRLPHKLIDSSSFELERILTLSATSEPTVFVV